MVQASIGRVKSIHNQPAYPSSMCHTANSRTFTRACCEKFKHNLSFTRLFRPPRLKFTHDAQEKAIQKVLPSRKQHTFDSKLEDRLTGLSIDFIKNHDTLILSTDHIYSITSWVIATANHKPHTRQRHFIKHKKADRKLQRRTHRLTKPYKSHGRYSGRAGLACREWFTTAKSINQTDPCGVDMVSPKTKGSHNRT